MGGCPGAVGEGSVIRFWRREISDDNGSMIQHGLYLRLGPFVVSLGMYRLPRYCSLWRGWEGPHKT